MAGVVIRTGSLANLDHFDSISVASGSFNGAVPVERSHSPSSLLRATYRRKSTSIFNLTSSQKGKSYESLQNLLREMDARREHACCLRATTTCETLQLSIADDCVLFTTDSWRSIVRCAQNLDQKQCEQQEAVWELLVTELHFIQRLNVLRKFYRDTITELQKRDTTLFPNLDCGKLFDNLDDIFEAHVMFWNKCCSSVILQARSTGLPLNPLLMYDGILKVNKFLECYSSYCAHYQSMTAYLKNQVQQDDNLQLLMSWFEEQPECERQPLSHWLMKPVQRLTKYPILMQAILKKTSDDQHRLLLRHMMDVLEDFVHTINRRVKESQEEEALIKVHHRLSHFTLYDGLTDEISSILAAFCGRQDLLRSIKGTFVKEFAVKIKKVDDQLRRIDAVLLLFSQTVLICKRLKKQGDRLKVIKPPLPLSKLQLYRLREAPSFLMVLLNSQHLVVEAHVLYASSIAQLDTILAALLRTQEALARTSTASSGEEVSCSRHFNFRSYEQSRESTDSANETETEVDSGGSPYTALNTPSPPAALTSPTSAVAAPLARSNALTSMRRSQLLAGRRCRTVSDCPLQHSMSFPPTCSVATHSPLRHSTSHLQDGPSAAMLARSSSEQEAPSTRPTLTRQRSASLSQDNNNNNNNTPEPDSVIIDTDSQTSRKTSLDYYLNNFLQHGATSSVDHSEDELDKFLTKSRSDSTIEYPSVNCCIHTIPADKSVVQEDSQPKATPSLSPSFPRTLRHSRCKVNRRCSSSDERGPLRKRENAFRQMKRNMHKNKRFLTDTAVETSDEQEGHHSRQGLTGYYRRRTGSWSESDVGPLDSPLYSTSTSRTSDYDPPPSSDVLPKEATLSRNSSSGISVASKSSVNDKELTETATFKKDNPWRFPRKLETLLSVRSSKENDEEDASTLFAGAAEYCRDLFRGDSLEGQEQQPETDRQGQTAQVFGSLLLINLATSAASQPNSRTGSPTSSIRKQSVENILDDSDLEITRV